MYGPIVNLAIVSICGNHVHVTAVRPKSVLTLAGAGDLSFQLVLLQGFGDQAQHIMVVLGLSHTSQHSLQLKA